MSEAKPKKVKPDIRAITRLVPPSGNLVQGQSELPIDPQLAAEAAEIIAASQNHYGGSEGDANLRRRVAEKIARYNGIDVNVALAKPKEEATPLAKQADIHLAVRPGTDLPVALAVHRFLFEEGHADEAFLEKHARGAERLRERAREWTFERAAAEADVPLDALRHIAELYATTRPAVIRCGYGQERNRNGGSASLAILALPAVAGKFGERGGGYMMSNSASWGITNTWSGASEPATRIVNMNQLGRALTESDPPIQLLFVYNSNPAVTTPDQRRVLRGGIMVRF